MDNLSFEIKFTNFNDFINHWEKKYFYSEENKYNYNIGYPLTEKSRLELFEWKNGSIISQKKFKSIMENYPLVYNGDREERYLNYKKEGGAIWNIFYLHCLEPDKYPIFDQHTYRAMIYIKTGKIIEIKSTNKQKYEIYIKEYIPFIKSLKGFDNRKLDKALFAFGQFLKIANKYI